METFVSAFFLFVITLIIAAIITFYSSYLFGPYKGSERSEDPYFKQTSRQVTQLLKSKEREKKKQVKAKERLEMS